MKNVRRCHIGLSLFVAVFCLMAGNAAAATLFWDGGTTNMPGNGDGTSQGGAGTWSTTVQNWDAGASPHVAWDNTANSNDTVILAGSVGLVTLGEDINLGAMHFSVASTGYTISNNTLNFSAGGVITATNNTVNQTIKSAINGSPAVRINRGPGGGSYEGLIFAPSSGTQTLGVIYIPDSLGGTADKAGVYLSGSTIGNTAASVSCPGGNYGALYKQGSGKWTVGNVNVGTVTITAGDLVATGTVQTYYNGLNLNGGVFHCNNAGAVYNSLRMNGGSFDNSSGAAITTSTYNPAQTWGGNWTFIGVNGANSDLNLGTGAVTLSGSRSVTVSNSLTTLTVGGVIGDGVNYYSLTKQGAGTLVLTTNNTYKGNTTVAAGTLSLSKTCLYDNASVSVSNGAVLNLNYTGTDTVFGVFFEGTLAAVGEWGGTGSAAANKTNLLGGTGILYHNGGLVATNTWLWDGPSYGGTGDGYGDGGAGVWSTFSNNWDQGVVSRKAWNNTTNDVAIFRGAVGTVDLQSDITLGRILVDGASGYVIGSTPETQTLNFGGTNNSIYVNQATTTFRSGITGSPNLTAYCNSGNPVYLYPDSASMTLGDVTVGGVPNNPEFRIGGATTNNSIRRIISANQWSFVWKVDAGTWTVGDVTCGTLYINSGSLVVTGAVTHTDGAMRVNGGTLHYNNPAAAKTAFIINSGFLENSSGAAITNSSWNPAMSWNGNFTFIGTNGTNSDLYLGNGAVTMSATRTVTINSNATLTVGGVISGAGFGLTKAGTGTLKLSGTNMYSGATIVTNGTLTGVVGGWCTNSAVTVSPASGTGSLAVSVTNNTKQWTCASLTTGGAGQPNLTFDFAVTPSTTLAPLNVAGAAAFTVTPKVTISSVASLVAGATYPLMTWASTSGTPPATSDLILPPGFGGTLAVVGSTLNLTYTGGGDSSIFMFY